jgi:uncharacterized protein (DUF924 family)
MEHPRQGGSTRGARGGILLERGEQRLHDPIGKLGAPLARVGRRLGQVREADLRDAATRERRFAYDAFVEDTAERVDVALARRLLALDQLGREVVRGTEQLAVGGQARRVGAAREPEVREGRDALPIEKDIRRLHVPVQDSARVQRVEPARELGGELGSLIEPERAERAQPVRQRTAGVERHRQIGAPV